MKKVMVEPERAEYAQILCEQNATPQKIMQVESALKSRGYPVNVDGQIDKDLTSSVYAFQQDSDLLPTGLMTVETVEKLGVSLK